MCLGKIGLKTQCLLVAGNRLADPLQVKIHSAQVQVVRRVIWVERNRVPNVIHRFGAVPRLVADQSQQMLGIGVLRNGTENLPIDLLGLR